jgi:hypothetical protein
VSPAGTPRPRRLAVDRARLAARRWKHRPGGNVIPLPPRAASAAPFDELTTAIVLDQYRRGVLPEGVIVALLACAGLQP